MLSILKNELVTGVSKNTLLLRKKELDWFCHNYWIIATQATLIAGFSFRQLTSSARKNSLWLTEGEDDNRDVAVGGSTWLLDTLHIALTSLSLAASLYVIVCAAFSCIFAPGLALRGSEGFRSMQKSIEILRKEQDRILWVFIFGLSCFVLASFVIVHFHHRHKKSAVRVQAIMLIVVVTLVYFAWRITLRFYHNRSTHSGIQVIERAFTQLNDLDAATSMPISSYSG